MGADIHPPQEIVPLVLAVFSVNLKWIFLTVSQLEQIWGSVPEVAPKSTSSIQAEQKV